MPLATCSDAWPSFLAALSPAVVALVFATASLVAAHARGISRGEQRMLSSLVNNAQRSEQRPGGDATAEDAEDPSK